MCLPGAAFLFSFWKTRELALLLLALDFQASQSGPCQFCSWDIVSFELSANLLYFGFVFRLLLGRFCKMSVVL